VKVVAAPEDTPADRAGVKAGDYITHIDGEFIYGFTLDEAVEKMRGKPGTPVKVTIVRPGRDKPFDVTVVRARIDLQPVKWEVKNNIGVININGFSANTGAMTREALIGIDRATGGKATGYVVDLRSNPGGLLDQAVEVSDAFLGQAEVVSERGRDPSDIERFYAKAGDVAHGKPGSVLVEAGSAGAVFHSTFPSAGSNAMTAACFPPAATSNLPPRSAGLPEKPNFTGVAPKALTRSRRPNPFPAGSRPRPPVPLDRLKTTHVPIAKSLLLPTTARR